MTYPTTTPREPMHQKPAHQPSYPQPRGGGENFFEEKKLGPRRSSFFARAKFRQGGVCTELMVGLCQELRVGLQPFGYHNPRRVPQHNGERK
jgi:hypothetical protein